MKYVNLIDAVKEIAYSLPNTGVVFEGDIYENLNTTSTAKYVAYNIMQNYLREDFNSGIRYFNINIFYVDRLTDSKDNLNMIISHSETMLKEILDRLEEEYDLTVTEATYTPFREKFMDICAGSYVTVTLTEDILDCED